MRNSKNWQHHEHIQFIKDAEMIGGIRTARVALQETVEAEAMQRWVSSLTRCIVEDVSVSEPEAALIALVTPSIAPSKSGTSVLIFISAITKSISPRRRSISSN